MSKLVDKERLAKLAKELDKRAKAAVAAEKERAMAAEQAIDAKAIANAAAIATINNTENGLLAQAKTHAQGLVDGEKGRAQEQEGLLSGRIEKLEGIVGSEAAGALGQVKKDVEANAKAITTLNSKVDVEGSVTKAITDAVAVEKERAEGIETGLAERIAANEAFVAAQPAIDKAQNDRLETLEKLVVGGEGEGIEKVIADVADAKAAAEAAQSDVDAVEQRLDAKGGLVDRIKANEAFVAGYAAKESKIREDFAAADTALHTTISDEIDADVLVETNRATAKEAELLQAINNEAARADAAEKANKAVIDKLDGTVDVEGSVKKQIKDAIDEVNGTAETLAGRVQANETKLAGLEKDTVQAAIDQAEKDAKDFAQGLVDAVNTAAGNLEDRVEANEAKLAGLANATVKAEIEAAQAAAEKHADDAITALVDSAPEAMNTLNELAKAIKDNKDIYDGYIAEHATAMATMKSELQAEIDSDVAAEAALRVAEETKIRGEFAAADTALHTTISAEIDADVKVEKERAEGKEAELLAAINKEVQDRTTAVSGVQGEVDALETVVKDMKDATKDGSLAKQIADEVTRANAEEKAIRSDFAAADKALHATIKGEMAQVVASLKVQIVDNKLQIGLGQGVDFVTLNQFELEMATDADIDAIINGLDAE